jgi:Family of unknown function (DUF6308)
VSDQRLLGLLRTGVLHRFADFHEITDLPSTGAGVYTIWDEHGQLVYVGIAGRNIAGRGLHGRLKSHYQGRRSGDQFCVYVGDRYVLPELTKEQRVTIGAGALSMDAKVRDYVRAHFAFRYVEVGDYATAMRVEKAVKVGALGTAPHLNYAPATGHTVTDPGHHDTRLSIDRLDGERLVLDGLGLARGFFLGDPSSIAERSYDSLAGCGERDRITTDDIQAINRTMRARSKHAWWEPVLNRDLDWLAAVDPKLDLVAADDDQWQAAHGERLVTAALAATIGPRRGPSVATKVLHLKRPRLFPVLDDFVAVMLGINIPNDATEARRIEIAVRLLLHLRTQGRRNVRQLQAIRELLLQQGIDRPLLRILDAIVWFSHPAAGVPGARRAISVTIEPPRDLKA